MKRRRQLIVLSAFLLFGTGLSISNRRAADRAPSAAKSLAFESLSNLAESGSIHWDEMDDARRVTYRGSRPATPTGGSHTRPKDSGGSTVQQQEEPLKLPFAFFGYGTVPVGAPRRAFLTDGTQVFIVAEGQTLVERFRVLCIDDAAVEIEDLSTGRRTTLPFDADLAARSRNSA